MPSLFLGVSFVALAFATGCGSGGGTTISPTVATPVPTATATPAFAFSNSPTVTYGLDPYAPVANPLTRDTEFTVSYDAKSLAVQQAGGAFVSLDDARAFDADLAAIRAAYPAVKDFRAGLRFDPKTIILSVDKSAPYLAKWRESLNSQQALHGEPVDLTSGEPTLDALLKKYDVVGLSGGGFVDNPNQVFLRVGATLNMPVAAGEFVGSSPYITSASAGYGDGIETHIYFHEDTSKATRIYLFSQPVYRNTGGAQISESVYVRTYTVHTDGSITEEITGTPPS